MCPNSKNCGKNTTVIIPDLISNGQKIEVNIDGFTDTYNFCSYWIKGPTGMKKNDQLWIQVDQITKAKVTLYLGKRIFKYYPNSTVDPVQGMGQSVG